MDVFDLGHIDAINDDNLSHYYMKPSFYENVEKGKKVLVVGRRGTGKTALVQNLIQINEKQIILINDYTTSSFNSTDKQTLLFEINTFICEQLFDAILDEFSEYNFPENLITENIVKFASSMGIIEPSFWKKFTGFLSKLKVSISELSVQYEEGKVMDIKNKASQIKKLLKMINKSLSDQSVKVSILLDELDYFVNFSNYKEINEVILDITYYFFSNYQFINLITFMRRDIYETLRGNPVLVKISQNMVNLDDFWNDKNLKEMIEKRIEYNSNKKVKFSDIFPPKKIKVGSNQYSFNYVIQRTFSRPRDLIRYTSEINIKLSEYDHALGKNEYQETITETALGAYSSGLLDDIVDEFFQRQKVLYGNAVGFELVESLRGLKIKNEYEIIEERVKNCANVKNQLISFDDAIKELYLMGVIGYDSSGKSHEGFYHHNPSQINKILNYRGKFIIHHGLRKELL